MAYFSVPIASLTLLLKACRVPTFSLPMRGFFIAVDLQDLRFLIEAWDQDEGVVTEGLERMVNPVDRDPLNLLGKDFFRQRHWRFGFNYFRAKKAHGPLVNAAIRY